MWLCKKSSLDASRFDILVILKQISLLFGYTNDYKKWIDACNEKSAAAMRKANSAAYRARKADENCNGVKTATTKMVIGNYGEPKTVKVFKRGIILLGIVTKADPNVDVSKFIINYDFYDITGDKHVAVIQGKQKYKIITDEDNVSNVQDVHTNLKPVFYKHQSHGSEYEKRQAKQQA